jgi:hypothetical protein
MLCLQQNTKGDALKNRIIDAGVVADAIEYLMIHQPTGITVSLT